MAGREPHCGAAANVRNCGMANLLDRITINPAQCGGRPCIRGMRIRVQDILEVLSGGMTREQVLADYDELEPDDIEAALAYVRRA
jgi:uncharacterized protein (DUF433 family)